MTLYLDTSSLVKLYVPEPGSDGVRKQVGRAAVVATSLVAYPEARAAFARRRRERVLTRSAFALAKRTLDAEWPKYLTIDPTAGLCREAGELAERYRLRGFDAVHLASFGALARRCGPRNIRFSSFDDRLNRSARSLRRALARTLPSRGDRTRRRPSVDDRYPRSQSRSPSEPSKVQGFKGSRVHGFKGAKRTMNLLNR